MILTATLSITKHVYIRPSAFDVMCYPSDGYCHAGEVKAANTLNAPKHIPLDAACTALAFERHPDPDVRERATALLERVSHEPNCSRFGSQMPNILRQAAAQMVLDVDQLHFVIVTNYQ